jgi:hypothetical protein
MSDPVDPQPPTHPFGPPDAANSPRVPSPFVTMKDLSAHAALVLGNDDLARVLVGRMGAGKTRFLLELRRNLVEHGQSKPTPVEFDLPNLGFVIRLAEDLAGVGVSERAELWRAIWKRAIVRSVVSTLLTQEDLLPSTPEIDGHCHRARELLGELEGTPEIPRSIYGEFGAILRDHGNRPEVERYIFRSEWDALDFAFEQLVCHAKRPLCYFLDAVEDESAAAPLYWLSCQKGLVMQVLGFTKNELLAENLQIFVGIRDRTWAALRRTGRASTLEQHPNVRVLRWDAPLVARFLVEKIRELPSELRFGDVDNDLNDATDWTTSWLGREQVRNEARGIDEGVVTYLLRHTRLIPRDIVTMGNFLAREVISARARGDRCVEHDRIRIAVANAARLSGSEELRSYAAEIRAAQLTVEAAEGRHTNNGTVLDPTETILEDLQTLLKRSERDILTIAKMDEIEIAADSKFEVRTRLAAHLWEHGLLGFSTASDATTFNFAYSSHAPWSEGWPADASHVAYHPCLADVLHLKPEGTSPVVPFPEAEIAWRH